MQAKRDWSELSVKKKTTNLEFNNQQNFLSKVKNKTLTDNQKLRQFVAKRPA